MRCTLMARIDVTFSWKRKYHDVNISMSIMYISFSSLTIENEFVRMPSNLDFLNCFFEKFKCHLKSGSVQRSTN